MPPGTSTNITIGEILTRKRADTVHITVDRGDDQTEGKQTGDTQRARDGDDPFIGVFAWLLRAWRVSRHGLSQRWWLFVLALNPEGLEKADNGGKA